MNRPSQGTVEALLSELGTISPVDGRFELWVPQQLTLRGKPTRLDMAMAIVLNQILRQRYEPDGFTQAEGGRLYRYKAMT